MFLLVPNNFTGLYRIDLQPALAQDVFNAVNQIERNLLQFLLGNLYNYATPQPTLNLLSQALLNNTFTGLGDIRFVSYAYREYVLDYVISRLYSVVGYRGKVKEENIYSISQNITGKIEKVRLDLCLMFEHMRNLVYNTNAFGNIVVDVSNRIYLYDTENNLAILPFALGMTFTDGTSNYVVSAEAQAGTLFTYTTTPAAPPNTSLRLVTRLKRCNIRETFI